MLKAILLAGAVTMSAPLLAQGMQSTPQTPPTTAETTPMTPQPETPPAQAPMDAATTSATTEAAPATDASGVSAVVEQEFASYDKDSNGSLNKVEFSAWMDALKAKTADATARKDPKWNDKAFSQADADKSRSVTKTELTGFLSASTPAAS